MKLALLSLAALALTACENIRVAGRLETPHGAIESDGKTVTVIARTGFAK